VAVDQAGDVVESTKPTQGASEWTVGNVDGSTWLLGVSCAAESLCVAIGNNGDVVTSTKPSSGASSWSTSPVDSGTALNGVSCPSTSLCVAVDEAGNVLSATNPIGGAGAWNSSQADSENPLHGVSCSSASLCVAVNGHGDTLSTTDPTGEAWTTAHVDSNNAALLEDVSCPTGLFCVAADSARNIISSTNSTGGNDTWSASQLFAAVWGVSCGSPSLCVTGSGNDLLSSIEPTGSASAWKLNGQYAQPVWPLPPHFAPHFRASCPSSSLCVAVDAFGDVLISTAPTIQGSWQGVISNPAFPPYEGVNEAENEIDPIFGVSCPSTSLCVAVDSHGYVSSTTDPQDGAHSVWSYANIDGKNAFEDVSCASESMCMAVDEAGNVLSSTNPTGGASTWSISSVDPGHAITSISCPSVSMCVAVDDAGNVLSSTDPTDGQSTWSISNVDSGHALTPVHALTSVSCSSVLLCVAVDAAGYAVVGTVPVQSGTVGLGEFNSGRGLPEGIDFRKGGPEGPASAILSQGGSGPSNRFTIVKIRVRSKGRIELLLRAPDAGSFEANAVTVPDARASRRPGRTKRNVRRDISGQSIAYGTASGATRAASTTTLVITPRKLALSELRKSGKLRPLVTVTFTPRGGEPSSKSLLLSVKF
jgi:hypothetical protein